MEIFGVLNIFAALMKLDNFSKVSSKTRGVIRKSLNRMSVSAVSQSNGDWTLMLLHICMFFLLNRCLTYPLYLIEHYCLQCSKCTDNPSTAIVPGIIWSFNNLKLTHQVVQWSCLTLSFSSLQVWLITLDEETLAAHLRCSFFLFFLLCALWFNKQYV